MKIQVDKTELAGALVALGKLISQMASVAAYKSVLLETTNHKLRLSTCCTDEMISVEFAMECEGYFRQLVPYAELRELVKSSSAGTVTFAQADGILTAQVKSGRRISTRAISAVDAEWPEPAPEPEEVLPVALPENFVELLAAAAPLVNRNNPRRTLQGINLSKNGITVTNGKELLNIPVSLPVNAFTIPFPLALLATKAKDSGTLKVWDTRSQNPVTLFRIQLGPWIWSGKALAGNYPNWQQVVPPLQSQTYHLKIKDNAAEAILAFLTRTSGDQFRLTPDDAETLKISAFADNEQNTVVPALVTGRFHGRSLILSRPTIEHLLMQKHRAIAATDGHSPIVATGGVGSYIAMPMYQEQPIPKEPQMQNTENQSKSAPGRMIATNHPSEPEAAVNPLDDLDSCIKTFKLKLKAAFDESAILARKVKEAQLMQKQQERDFIQARRAIERIRMAI